MTYKIGDPVFHVPSNQFGTVFETGATDTPIINDPETGQEFIQDAPADPDRVRISWDLDQTLNWVAAGDVVPADDPVALEYIVQRDRRNDQLNQIFP